jgi:tetratricopeptide (TPR) repeat protein
VTQADQEQHVYSFLVLDTGPLIRAVTGLMEAAPLGAYILFMGGVLLRLWGPRAEAVARVRDELEEKAGAGLAERQSGIRNASLADILSEALIFTIGATDQAEATRRILAHAEQYFEETWLQRPLLSLNGVAPRDAALNAALRKKLRGVVQFLQESAVGGVLATYDFDRLRRKLGLLEGAPTPVPSAVGDITTMDAAALTALQVDSLTDEQLEQVFQAAQRLDVTDLSVRFARALTARPARPERGDRYPWYHYLMQQAQSEGNTDAALQYINEGEKADSEQNEGRRRNDYDLRRGQIHARRGEADAAHEVFQRLIQRDPDNLKSHGAAAEAMLSLRQAERALRFAEEGLVQARRQNNRDLEQHLLELAGAARKMTQSS